MSDPSALDTIPDAAPPAMDEAPASEAAPAKEPPKDDDPSKSVGKNTLLYTVGTLASRVLGMLRESMIAAAFDPRDGSTDAFFAAWRIPNALRSLLAEGASRYVFQPVLSDAYHGGKEPSDRAALARALASLRGFALVVLALVTLLGMLFSRPLLSFMAAGFRGDEARLALGAGLLRWLFPFLFFMGWFAIDSAVLGLVNRVRPIAFAPVMLNVAFVLAPFLLSPLCVLAGYPAIYGLAAGALVGVFLQTVWPLPTLRREGLAVWPRFRVDATVRETARLFLPQLYGQAVFQLNTILALRFLGSLPTGSVTFYNYAQRLADIPQGLFAASLAAAAASAMQGHATRNDVDAVARTYEGTLRTTLFVATPLCVVLAVYAEALVPLVYGYGRFRALGEQGALEVVSSLRWQAMATLSVALVGQTAIVFAAFKRRADVVRIATVALATFFLVGHLATPRFGHVGVVMASFCSVTVQLVLLLRAVAHLVPVRFASVLPTAARVLLASGVTALCARALVLLAPVDEASWRGRFLALAGGGALVAVYLALAWVLRIEGLESVRKRVLRRR